MATIEDDLVRIATALEAQHGHCCCADQVKLVFGDTDTNPIEANINAALTANPGFCFDSIQPRVGAGAGSLMAVLVRKTCIGCA